MKDKSHSDMRCRLCAGSIQYIFSNEVLGKYTGDYYRCLDCSSLQTQLPFWLDEAYERNSLSRLDTGAVQRNLHNFAATYLIAKLFNCKNLIDLGGGDGLLCRLLRDYSLNCFVKDKYADVTYSQGFTFENFDFPDLTLAFEVIEHFENPVIDLDELFKYKSSVILVSTGIYSAQGKDWWYLVPEAGQHVFFYSLKGLEWIAARYGYTLIISGGFVLFVKCTSIFKKLVARILLRGGVVRLWKALIIYAAAPGAWRDHVFQVESVRNISGK